MGYATTVRPVQAFIRLISSRTGRDLGLVLGSNVGAAGLGFLTTVVVSRTLGPSQFGVVSTAIAVALIITGLTDFGIGTGLVRFASRYLQTDTKKADVLLAVALKAELALGALIIIAAPLMVSPLAHLLGVTDDVSGPLWLAFIIGLWSSIGTYPTSVLQSFQRFGILSALGFGANTFKLLAVGGLLLLGLLTPFRVLVVYAVIPFLSFVVGMAMIPKDFVRGWHAPGQRSVLAELLSFSKWTMLSFAATAITGRIDFLLLSSLKGSEAVGIYAVGFQLASSFPLIFGSLTTVLLPRVSGMTRKSEYTRFIRRSTLVSLPVYAVVLLLLLVSPWLIELVFGDKYAPSAAVFRVLLIGLSLGFIINPLSLLFYAWGRPQVLVGLNVLQMILITAGNILLIPAMGPLGSATAYTVASFVGAGYVVMFLVKAMRRLPTDDSAWPAPR